MSGSKEVHLSEMQVHDLRNVFNLFDADGSGTINIDELSTALQTLGQKVTQEELQELMKEMDTDESGTVEFEEFAVVMGPRMFDNNDDNVEQAMIEVSVFPRYLLRCLAFICIPPRVPRCLSTSYCVLIIE